MSNMPRLSHDERVQLVTLSEEGYTRQMLMNKFGVSHSCVKRLLKKSRQHGIVDDLPKTGRPKTSTVRQDRCLRRICMENSRQVSRRLQQRWSVEYGVNATARTVRNRLLSMGLRGRIAQRKPLVSAANRKKRLLWANARKKWSESDWEQCVFSDESAVHLFPNNRRYIRCPASQLLKPQNVQPRVQAGGGHVMVWGGFAGVGVTALARVNGNINTVAYISILKENLLPLQLPDLILIFQQDNAPAHKS